MPLAGWMLVQAQGLTQTFLLVAAFWGALGNTIGSVFTYWIGALGLAAVLVVVLTLLERWRPWRDELGRDVDGDLGAVTSQRAPQVRIAPAE